MRQQVEREHDVERLVGERQLAGVGLDELDSRRTALTGLGEHFRRDVHERDVVALGQPCGDPPVTAADVEHPQPLVALEPGQHGLPLALVQLVERIGRVLCSEVAPVALAQVQSGCPLVERLEPADDGVDVVLTGCLLRRFDDRPVLGRQPRLKRLRQRVGVARRDEPPPRLATTGTPSAMASRTT